MKGMEVPHSLANSRGEGPLFYPAGLLLAAVSQLTACRGACWSCRSASVISLAAFPCQWGDL